MAEQEDKRTFFAPEDHQVAYVFHPDDAEARPGRPAKRRKVSKPNLKTSSQAQAAMDFVPLLNGAEKPAAVHQRERLFSEGWDEVHGRVQTVLRESNTATLDQVKSFVGEAKVEITDKIPSAFIITGPDIAAQDLLFEQLSESLQQSLSSKFVRLRSSDGTTLKATLKKIIRDATAKGDDADEDDLRIGTGQNERRYLDYDLEALYSLVKQSDCEHVFVAFQDSEGFESGLLSDLILLFNSWRPRIPFTLLFGIATSVDLLQARLLKSVCQLIHGAQFDVVQTGTILESVFRTAVAAKDVPMRLGAPLLRSLLDRQHEQVAGIQAFTSSLKYAYMCHFYANSLSALCDGKGTEVLQTEHIEAARNTPSFRREIDRLVASGDAANLVQAKDLLENDNLLRQKMGASGTERDAWVDKSLRALLISEAAGAQEGTFSEAYVHALEAGISAEDVSRVSSKVQRMEAEDVARLVQRVVAILGTGDHSLRLDPSDVEMDHALHDALIVQGRALDQLRATATEQDIPLRSKYSGQSRVMRTTVIAQRVQLSRDTAALRDEDKRFTEIIDEVVKLLAGYLSLPSASSIFLSEAWLYDSRAPLRDVLVPRPQIVFKRCLTRPHDYLGCSCCKSDDDDGGIQATLPSTSILYQMYQETGNLINVADLWTAFYALRKALAAFYRGMAELRALGFVKPSKKKADHVAKVKWL
ncbi:hypothetical protein NLU13_9060 [Sarocladium strictum]|uniref:Origin recognition complex subunit n=1 Tax=Sarocladium strictum TaxID=5046 RepID=A0AA39L3U5_SARSR|nr:hypothetical protein NLU13_9060 [Sarocladium strictum]